MSTHRHAPSFASTPAAPTPVFQGGSGAVRRSRTRAGGAPAPAPESGEPVASTRAPGAASRASAAHLGWIVAAGVVGFLVSFALGDRPALPVDLYYLIYFTIVAMFVATYVRRTNLDLGRWIRPRLGWAVALGIVGGMLLTRAVLAEPGTGRPGGGLLAWDLAWRGVVYGAVDGVLLLAFPWLVVARAFGREDRGWAGRLAIAPVAWVAVLFVTTAYHAGYGDFRSAKMVQPNVGSTIALVPTLVSANPIASPISHVFMHVAAVLHAPETELFLPPHRAPIRSGPRSPATAP